MGKACHEQRVCPYFLIDGKPTVCRLQRKNGKTYAACPLLAKAEHQLAASADGLAVRLARLEAARL